MINSGGHDGGVFDNLGSLLGGGDATSGFLNSGSGILKSLMGNQLGSVVDIIASVSGLKKGASSSIMSMAAPLVMGMVGRFVKNKALDAVGLGKFLGGQSKHVANALPSGMGNLLGFGSGMGDKVEAAASTARETATAASSGGSSMLTRVLPLLLLLGVGYFGWQYFGNAAKAVGDTVADGASSVVDGAKDAADATMNAAGDVVDGAAGVAGDMVDGAKDAAGATMDAAGDMMDGATKAAKEALGSVKFAAGSVGEKFSGFLSGDRSGDATFSFNNLTFATGSANINDMSEVNNLAAVLKAYPSVNIEVGGHTDSSGNADKNMVLSEARAAAVKAQLAAQGITGDRVTVKGYGSTAPTTDNAADAANRRVEIKVVK